MLSKERKRYQLAGSFYLNRWRYLELFLGISGQYGWFQGPPVTLEELDLELREHIYSDLMAILKATGDLELQRQIESEMESLQEVIGELKPRSPPPHSQDAVKLRSKVLDLRNRFIDRIQEFSNLSGG